MLKKKMSSYNDGVVGVYSEKSTLTTDFNAKTNAKTINDYKYIDDLCFKEQSKRQEDFLFAEAMGKKLTWKIKTPLVDWLESNHKIIYEGYAYNIINIDPDRANKDSYIYLERGQRIEE